MFQEQNTEIVWTILPVIILLIIAAPSLQTLYLIDYPFTPLTTLKATGHQWFWSYEYSDFPEIEFNAYLIPSKEVSFNRLLELDNSTPLPTITQIRVLTTSTDVIHAWTVPALGVKADAIPGRLNQIIFLILRPGIYFGQCSEICGANHSFIPIKIEACPINHFIRWISKTSS